MERGYAFWMTIEDMHQFSFLSKLIDNNLAIEGWRNKVGVFLGYENICDMIFITVWWFVLRDYFFVSVS